MGLKLNGLFLSFQSLASLGGLGDLGMGGVVNIQTSRLLGRGDETQLRSFLASVRGLFLVLGLLVMFLLLMFSPWLPQWLRFEAVPGAGSFRNLFALGAVSAGLLIFNSYIANLNYGCGNLTLSVLPTFLLVQISFLGHWLLAREGFSLWVQYIPYVLSSVAGLILGWVYIRFSHPTLAHVFPIGFDKKNIRSLFGKTFWLYFYYLAAGVYATTDRLLITAGFGGDQVPPYVNNNKLCELALFVVISSSLAAMPKITQWMASPEVSLRERSVREIERLNKFQTFLGCAGALVYLAVNDLFMRFWLGPQLQVPVLWQVAFAAQLSVSAAGYVGFDLAARCSERGIRIGGVAVIATAIFNFGLSYLAMKCGSILGIAVATAFAQSCLVLGLGRFSFGELRMSWWKYSFKPWLLAVAAVTIGFCLKFYFPFDSFGNGVVFSLVCAVSLMIIARFLDISLRDFRHELTLVRGLLKRKS
ncbi:MAG: hypothetical protein ABI042_05415 [Verrucomicrobiota bacterium]